MPNTAGRAAAQRLHGDSQLISGLERLARPAVPFEAVSAIAFEIPRHGRRILAGDFQCYERMRVGEFELPNNADQLNRVLPVEHSDRVMPERPAARRKQSNPENQSG